MTKGLGDRAIAFLVLGALMVGVMFAVIASSDTAHGDRGDEVSPQVTRTANWQGSIRPEITNTPTEWQANVQPQLTFTPYR